LLERRDQRAAAADVGANIRIERPALAREFAVLEGIAIAERRAALARSFARRT